jgi:hypothetical protein
VPHVCPQRATRAHPLLPHARQSCDAPRLVRSKLCLRNEKVSRGRLAPNVASARLAGRRTPYVATLAEDETGSPHTADAWPLGLPVEDDVGSANITRRQTASPLLLGVLDPNLQAAKPRPLKDRSLRFEGRSRPPQASRRAIRDVKLSDMVGVEVPGSSQSRRLAFEVVEGDITSFAADLVAFKYARGFHGADREASRLLARTGIDIQTLRPGVGEHCLEETTGALAARQALFVGVPRLFDFEYQQLREFGASVVRILADEVPGCRHLAMTLHGPNYGLDEVEALLSMLTGCMEGVAERPPPNLDRISVVERDASRAGRLRRALQQASHHSGEVSIAEAERGWLVQLEGATGLAGASAEDLSRLPGASSERKPHIFVAMPFAEAFDDLFEFGIQRPIRELGFLCERGDQDVFTGDVLDRIKSQIEASTAIVAVLTGANPNVYLEVGYAWGRGRPTILVTEDAEDPRFDLRGQRYLKYRRIKDVEKTLTRELRILRDQGGI